MRNRIEKKTELKKKQLKKQNKTKQKTNQNKKKTKQKKTTTTKQQNKNGIMKKDKCLPQVNNSNRQTESAGEPQQEMSSSNSNTTATRGQHVEKDIRKTRMTKLKNRGRNAYRR